MSAVAIAALESWNIDPLACLALLLAVWVYWRGWRQLHAERPERYPVWRLAAFLVGVSCAFVAIDSPLDTLAGLLLEVHMIQHLLLIMVAPPLIWLGQPVLAGLRGLPPRVRNPGLSLFLTWPFLRRWGQAVTNPIVCWMALNAGVVFWHIPRFYDLALRSPPWHQVEHACFFYAALLFWWPVVQVWPSRARWSPWMAIPYLILADLVNTALSAFLIFSDRVLYETYQMAPRLWGISALEDQAKAGAIMWVPGSAAYIVAAVILAVRILGGTRGVRPSDRLRPAPAAAASPIVRKRMKGTEDLLALPVLRLLRYKHSRRVLQAAMLVLAVGIVVDGFLGPQVSPINLAGVLPWTHWRALSVIALLAAGNLFCMSCPFTLPRDLVRRFWPARFHWPQTLRSKWIAVTLLVTYLWAYEAFHIWDSPRFTAWIVVGYFTAALLVDSLFKGASFCKYVCPIGQFHFVNSLASPLEVKVNEPRVCSSCRTYDCLRGNERQRGCELQLFQPRKSGNLDCTFCLDCVHACPSNNVGVFAVMPGAAVIDDRRGSGIGRLTERPDVAVLATVLVFGAFVAAAGMVAPVMTWLHGWHARLGVRSMLPVTTAFYILGLAVAPVIATAICTRLSRTPGTPKTRWSRVACSFASGLVPLGLSMWASHFLYHFATGWRGAFAAACRILHHPYSGVAVSGVPGWLPAAQILSLDLGLVLTMWVLWRIAFRRTQMLSGALRSVAPWAALAVSLYSAGIWILFQPMEMRGMMN